MSKYTAIPLISALAFSAVTAVAQQNDGLTTRGVLLKKQPGNVSYDIELSRGVEHSIVQPNYHFQSGDRFTLRVMVSRSSYVYVLNRSFVGAPDELKAERQIRLVPDDGQQSAPAADQTLPPQPPAAPAADPTAPVYTLVYPLSGNRMLNAGKVNLIPGSQMTLQMDDHPGIEQLVLVVSPTPLDIDRLFNASTGEMDAPSGNGGSHAASQDPYAKLQTELLAMAKNSEAEESTRSIVFEDVASPPPTAPSAPPAPSMPTPASTSAPVAPPPPVASQPTAKAAVRKPASIAAPKVPQQPYLVDIVLQHYAG